ncbi:MAG TPA: cytochrome c oxidase subunit II [Gemmataceae bacterium]|nr:cytochrome c oxidase subunit II [Gemmataceae bacterium]
MIPSLLANTLASVQNLSIFDPASPSAESIRKLAVLVLAITGFIFIVVEGILVYSIVRFRRRAATGNANQPLLPAETAGETRPPEPPQVYGSKPIEIAWTAAPALVVFVLVMVSARTLWEVNVPPPPPRAGDNTLFVTVVGRQWWWEYGYDHYNGRELGFTTANELHIPVSEEGIARPVYLTLKSADVCHSFWVPRLGGKTDLIPGRVNSMWFQTDRPGLYLGQCAEYCGTQHANMLLRVVVDSPRDFERWLENERKPAIADTQVSAGRSAFLAQSCINCHRVRGTAAQGGYAPDLTHLMSRQTLASGMIPNTPENLRRWVADPQPIKPGCLMPAFGLGEREREDIVRYLLTLR